jgi:hypothetical protein
MPVFLADENSFILQLIQHFQSILRRSDQGLILQTGGDHYWTLDRWQ